ncbi:hypothetical protein T484DRAFT_1861780, partial [Baffinella frigidus]
MEYLGEHIHHNQQHNLPTEGIVLSLYWDQEAMPEQSPQRPQRGMNGWSPGPGDISASHRAPTSKADRNPSTEEYHLSSTGGHLRRILLEDSSSSHRTSSPILRSEARRAWRVHSDNAYMIPSPTTADFHEWDHNLLARMCRTFWDEYRTAINCLLYPMDTEWNALQRKRQSADEFQTLQQHITWNQGFNSNLLQMIVAVFPSYNEWIRRTVLSAGCAFRFMGLDQEPPRYTVLSNDILQGVYNAIITSTSQGDLIDPAPSRFTLLHNQRDRTAHHMCAVTEVMLDFYNGSTDTVLDNDTSFLWSGWDQES